MPELDRRDFLRLVGVGAGAAAAAGCSDPIEKLVPYVIEPEVITPGIPVYYASTCRECPAACGLHVKTREGRPVKLEGNPQHPINRGKLCPRGQAGIGRTYHPDRYPGPMVRGSDGQLQPISWEDAEALLVEKLRGSARRTWVLGPDRGPSINGIIDSFVSRVGAGGRVVYQAFAHEALRLATEQVFGTAVVPHFDVSKADLILDFGSDFLDAGPSPVEAARQFADAQDIHEHPAGGARLVSIGPRLSMTASNADQWVACSAGSEGLLAAVLARAVFDRAKAQGRSIRGDEAAIAAALRRIDRKGAAARAGIDAEVLDGLVDRLLAAKAPVALPPGVAATGPAATSTATAVLLLNALVGAVGPFVKLPVEETSRPAASLAELRRFVDRMKVGQVDVLLVHDANPVYSLPGGVDLDAALEKVGFLVSFAALADETSQRADLVLPDLTPLESWGDAEPRKGVRSLQQPTIRPLHDGRALGDTLLAAARGLGRSGLPKGSVQEIVKANWRGSDFRAALDRGGEFAATPLLDPVVTSGISRLRIEAPKFEGHGQHTVIAYPHSFLADGSGAALPWLQEIPDPVTKASWLPWAEISEATASRLGVEFGDVIAVETGFGVGSIELPVYPRGGVRDDVVAIPIGQGHTVGLYASGANDGAPGAARGANVLSILPAVPDRRGARAFLATNASLSSTGAFQRIPLSQWTDNQRGRELIPEVTLASLTGHADEHAAEEHGGGHHSGPPFEYDKANDAAPDSPYRWSMAIDNDRCTGCSACVAACYVENNVPLVGQEGVTRRRDMSWIRIERYIGEGDRAGGAARRPHPDREQLGQVEVRQAPMLCQHCGAAPCESVCPVFATYHTPEGLNGMVFNRCVGTRYCANNCTYKVRRFNYFDYSREQWPGLFGLMLNPDVTVRGQGVMEKCSMCVQRIESGRQTAKDEGRLIGDGEVQTACQQSCPTNAITFGNARDPQSEVVSKSSDPRRSYASLQELNTRPGLTYLAQIRRDSDDGRSHG